MKWLFSLVSLVAKGWDRFWMYLRKFSFYSVGHHVVFHPTNSDLDYSNISIGDYVYIGSNCRMWAVQSHIYLAHHISIAPNVSIIAGNHSSHIVGKYITDYKTEDKRLKDDLPVIVDSDVWIGTNVTILNGVHVGRGCIVAAGSVVNKDTPPYSVIGGVPAKVIKYRFSAEEILSHEQILYPEEDRMTPNQVKALF